MTGVRILASDDAKPAVRKEPRVKRNADIGRRLWPK
jgi:hypothetical protein